MSKRKRILKAIDRKTLLPINKVDTLKVEDGDLILVKVDRSIMDPQVAKKVVDLMKEIYPDNFVLFLSDEFSIEAMRLKEDGKGGYTLEPK